MLPGTQKAGNAFGLKSGDWPVSSTSLIPMACPSPILALLSSIVMKPIFPCLEAPLLLATVVEFTAEAGVAPDARRAESTGEVRAVHLRAHNSEEMSWHCIGGRTLWDWKCELVTCCEMNTPMHGRVGQGTSWIVHEANHCVAGLKSNLSLAYSVPSLKCGDGEEEGWIEEQTEEQIDSRKWGYDRGRQIMI